MFVAICCSCALDAFDDWPFWVRAEVIACVSDCCDTPWALAIALRLAPACSCCWTALVLRPRELEAAVSTFCQAVCVGDVCWLGQALVLSIEFTDIEAPIGLGQSAR